VYLAFKIERREVLAHKVSKRQEATCVRAQAYVPNKITAVRTESRLPQEGSHEFVTIYLMDPSPHCSTSAIEALTFFELPSFLVLQTLIFIRVHASATEFCQTRAC